MIEGSAAQWKVRSALVALAVAVPVALTAAMSGGPGQVDAAALAMPRYTVEQRLALERARQDRAHPKWRELSLAAKTERLGMMAGRAAAALRQRALQVTSSLPPVADFEGNRTLISADPGQGIVLDRQSDCSLRYSYGSYTVSFTSPSIQVLGSTPNFQNTLHALAGLNTTANGFAGGCAMPTLGIGSRRGLYLGRTNRGHDMFALAGYDGSAGTNALYLSTIDPVTREVQTYVRDHSQPEVWAIAAGDLDGDGLADVVGLDLLAGSIGVWLARHDGNVGALRTVALPGGQARAAVMADFNGDGKIDVVVATLDGNQEVVSVLTGRGDGTFAAPQSINVATPGGTLSPAFITNLVATDLRGLGRLDVVASNGVVLLNSGAGQFTPAASAFAPTSATSTNGPNLVAADFNHDGKPDVAVNNGATIRVFLGRGDGTFAGAGAYASNDSVGYMTATDLDGDGHVDLYVGLANGGYFVGDQFDVGKAYVLMGSGDGTFRGAPAMPFVHTGQNLADLNGDGVLDAVGVNADVSFTSYIGDGHGGFAARRTLPVATITLGGQGFPLREIETFALADVNGDGKADLVFIGKDFVAHNPNQFNSPGMLVAIGDGQGGFAAPLFMPAPAFSPPGDFDLNLRMTNLHVADVNGDGKADLVYTYRVEAFTARTLTVGTAVQLGLGDGSFLPAQTIVFHNGPSSTPFFQTSDVQLIADLNGDGKPDLVFLTQTPTTANLVGGFVSKLQVAPGAGNGSFATPVDVGGPELIARFGGDSRPAALVLADMNADGVPDLVALGGAASGALQIAVMRGKGDGSFNPAQLKNYAGQYLNSEQQIAVADFNGDGKPDVAVFDPFSGRSGMLFGNGDGTLQSAGSTSAPEPNRRIVLPLGGPARVMDFNGDGQPDVLVGQVLLMSTAAAVGAMPDFGLSAASAAASVAAGQSTSTTLTLSPSGGFSGTVAFSCSGLPAGAACTFAPPSLTLGGATASTTLTISTAARSSASAAPWSPAAPGLLAVAGLPAGLLVLVMAGPLGPGRRRVDGGAVSRWMNLGVAVMVIASLHACGGGGGSDSGGGAGGSNPPPAGGTPAGTYAVQVTASGGGATHTANFQLTVN